MNFFNNWERYKEQSKPVIEKTTSKDNSLFSEEEMIEYGIQSVQMISEATWAPRMRIRLLDGREISCSVNRSMLEDMRSYFNIDVRSNLRDIIKREVEHLVRTPRKEIKRVYSDLDPYGEEQWEN
jgi:aryl carrier-like protein